MSLNDTVTQARQAIWQECVGAIQHELSIDSRRSLIIMPPRFGEESVFARLATSLFDKGARRVLCLSEHRVSLQYVERTLRTQLGKGFSYAVSRDNQATNAQIVLSTYRAMENHLGGGGLLNFTPDSFDCVVCFDCDRSGAEKFRQIVEFFTPRLMRLGITPTAWRHDGSTIHDLFGETTYAVSLGEAEKRGAIVVDYQNVLDRLQEEGVLVRPTGIAYARRVNSAGASSQTGCDYCADD